MLSSKGAPFYLLIGLGMLPVLLLGLGAAAALLAYAMLEDLVDSTIGAAQPMDESQAREIARRLAMGYELP